MGTKNYDNALDLITFSRASGGTSLRRVGYGAELVTNGTFDSDLSGWTVFDNCSVVSGEAVITDVGGTDGAISQQLSSVVTGDVVILTFDQSAGTNLIVQIGFTAGSNFDNQFSGYGVGSHEIVFVAKRDAPWLTFRSFFTDTSNTIDNISVKEVIFDRATDDLVLFNHPADIPRIDYAADGTVKGLLIEEARTNNVTNSEACEFIAQVSGTVTTSTTAAPFGLTSVVKRVQASTLDSGARLSVSVLVGGDNHCSVYVRSRTGADQNLKVTTSGNVGVTQVAPASGDWVRLGRTASLGAGSRDMRVLSVGDAIDLDIALPQVELGSFPTSYIPTSGATATRAADIASIPVTDFGYNQKAGTVVVEFDSISLSNSGVYSLDSGLPNGLSSLIYPNNRISYQVSVGGSFQANINFDDYAVSSQVSKVANVYAENDFAAVLDGGTVDTDTSGTVPQVSTLRLGAYLGGSASFDMSGHIKSIQYYPRRLTNTQLQELTA